MKTTIGYFNLKEDTVFTNLFSFAAWYEHVLVKAGKYPLEVHNFTVNEQGEVRGYISSAYVTMPGVVTDDYFAAHCCGVPVSDYDGKKNAGKLSAYTAQHYLYEIADSVLHEKDSLFELLPEYEAREIHFTYQGNEETTHGIFLK